MRKILAAVVLSSFFAFSPFASASDGPVVHLRLDEGSGNTGKDASGNGLDGTLENIAWEERGVTGKAVRFNGRDSAIRLPVSPKLNFDKAVTLSVWFKAEPFEKGMNLFSLENYRHGWSAYAFRSFLAFSSLPMKASAVARAKIPSGTSRMDPWHHAVYTIGPDPANGEKLRIRIYLDGKLLNGLKPPYRAEFQAAPPITAKSGLSITLGNFASAEAQAFRGLMDEVKIYARELTKEEIEAEYKAGTEQRPETLASPVQLKKIDFPPLKNTRIAIHVPPVEKWAVPVRSPEWFREQAEKLGCSVTLLDDAMLGNKELLRKEKFDTLILPSGVMPLEAEDSIFTFLTSGGNLLTCTVLPGVYNRHADGTFGTFNGKILKNHPLGWYAPFLLRENPGPTAGRKWISPLGLDPAAADLTGDLLPAVCGPVPNLFYRPLDSWNKHPGIGDGVGGDGVNYAQGADLKFDLYSEGNGMPADFTVYRYFNSLIRGSTLVNLGWVGTHLLKGEDGEKVFQAALRLMESPLPGQQSPEYYETVIGLHEKWSELGFVYTEAVSSLRDAAFYLETQGGEWKSFRDALNEMEKEYFLLTAERKAQLALLVSGKYGESASAAEKLLKKVKEASARFASLAARAKETLRSVDPPEKPEVHHKYKTIPSIASFTVPLNLSRLRGRLFRTIRRIGSNVYSGQPFPEWYAEDAAVQKQMEGILRDHKFVYQASPRRITGGGKFNPGNGTVQDAEAVPYPEKAISAHLKGIFEVWAWKGKEQFRIGSADETGLGLNFWGTPAKEALQKRLRAYYRDDIAAMNSHCGTAYKSFDEVEVPVRRPETPAQHAVWEHFRLCREALLESFYSRFRDLVKQLNPEIDVFQLPSTGGSLLPLYGQNYYNLTKYQDVSGIDGTSCAINQEWIFCDLTTKRYLTSEWGTLYQEAPLQKVHGQLWQEMGAGALGAEQFLWSYGNDSCNYADALDIPTIYGAVLHTSLKEMRKLDHLLLDGNRAEPEIGILFSQTSRTHDQGWGWAGESTWSPHMHTVSVYYKHFLSFGRSARVFAEETLLEGVMPHVKVLIVPQAEFLSPEVQKKLLEYAGNGGRLILEGRAGRFDDFGHDSYLLFRETGIVPAFPDSSEAILENARIALEKDNAYAPEGTGQVLASYTGGKPAILIHPHGKGSVTFLGFSAGRSSSDAFAPVLERILRALGIGTRFKVSDPDVVLREWTHPDGTFLLLTTLKGKPGRDWGLEETEVRIRGKVKVEDYLFGKEVKTKQEEGYTVFRTLTANGCRVFRLHGEIASPETPIEDQPAFPLKDTSGTRDETKEILLPWKGRLYADTPLKAGPCTFSTTILGSGNDSHAGTAYISVSTGNEVQKKRIEDGQTVFFRTRAGNYEIKCESIFFMYPFHAVLEIREIDAVPISEKASAKTEKDRVILSNDLLSLTFDPARGGSLVSFLPAAEKENLIGGSGAAWALSGKMPGPFVSAAIPFSLSEKDGSAAADFVMSVPVQGKILHQKITLPPDAALCKMDLACINAGTAPAKYDLKYHPELRIGGGADSADAFFIGLKDGSVRNIPFRGQNRSITTPECGDWAAIVDTRAKRAWISTVKPGQTETFYIWEASDFYTLEIFTPKKTVEPGDALHLDLNFLYLHGLTGVSAVSGLNAAHLVLPDAADQTVPLRLTVEAATAIRSLEKISLEVSLFRGEDKIADFKKSEESFAFDLPVVFSPESKENLAGLPDGDYTVRVHLRSRNGNLSFRGHVRFAGHQLRRLSDECSSLEQALAARGKKISGEKRFACRLKLGSMRRAITEKDPDAARKLADEFRAELGD